MVKYQKAIIEIHNNGIEEVQEKESKPSVTSSLGLSAINGISDKLQQQMENPLTGTLPGNEGNNSADTERFEVQFNPTEISIGVVGKVGKGKTGADVKHKNIDYGRNLVRLDVTIPLIFDGETRVADKFLAAIRDRYSRNIVFSWGNQIYSGELYSVSAEYTMFSKQGIPIRTKITLKILCNDSL